jgi:hypothetical protein
MFKNNLLQVDVQVNQNIQDMLRDANINVDFNENLSDSQKKALELFKEGNNLLILGAGGCGKCMKVDTPIIMYDGTIKKIQDINVGELIMGDDSTPRKVLNTTTGRDIMYEIKNVKGETYVVNSHHILSLKYSNKKNISDRKQKNDYSVRWFNNKTIKVESKCFSYKNKNKEEVFIQARQFLESIIEDRYVDIPIKNYIALKGIKLYLNGYSTGIDFKEKKLDFDPYIIGIWLGDGTAINTEITNKDSTIIKYLKNNLSKYNCYLSYIPSRPYGYNICSTTKKNPYSIECTNYFKQQLINNNLLDNKHIPHIYKCNSRENRLKLLAGILDADGSFNDGCYELSQSLEHENLIDDIIYLCRSLGFACYKNKKTTSWTYKNVKNYGEAWRIIIHGKGLEEIPVLCPRKKAYPRKQIKDVLVSGITVTELGEDKYYGFELDDNHRFVLGNFIVTHNSHIIKTMEEYVKTNHQNKKMYLSSTTGISAYNIGGMTIHSFMGIGTGDMPIDVLISRIKRRKMYRDRIINTDILVIDEVSMLSGELFEKLNLICQNIRKNNMFFGGIQVIFTGDFLQLLPVFNKNKDLYENIDDRLIIESPLFNRMFNDENIIILKENFRQKNDSVFINVLLRIRDGTFTEDDINVLKTRQLLPENIQEHVHLVSSNKKAQTINDTQLNKLKTPKVKYTSSYTSSGKNKEIKELLTKELQFQFTQKGINELILKKGARVMLIKNLDVSLGLVNGAIGTIVNFIPDPSTDCDIPIVKFDNSNIKHPISVVSWELEIDGCKGMANQIPLMLAYSVTIHKSQSLTLDSGILDLGDCFCDHQIYVALSRLKSLNGLYLKSFNKDKISVNKKMRDFLTTLT